MATPTQSPTNGPDETDPFFYDYATVQTVGMTLATIMFVLGIIIILSKKVKCRKADSRSESPTCKSCLGSDDPQRAYSYPRPRDSGLKLLGSRSPSPVPWDPRVPHSCISWSPSPGPSRLALRVHILSLINVHSVFSPFCLCVVVCGHQRTGWELRWLSCPLLLLQGLLLSPHPSFHTSPKGSSLLCTLVPICVPQSLEWRPPPSVPHRPPPPQLPPLPVGPGNRRGND
ncbi:FXYD domain-containing ion transport regulator 7 isoform X1 [Arvicanthis niloticus]|uniref:FXYD domain-containing ion transport regulator 7 isoform X1 n=1 Tax=Arvicanthis niloticus TaxID=61156 RepID=UPI00402B0C9A